MLDRVDLFSNPNTKKEQFKTNSAKKRVQTFQILWVKFTLCFIEAVSHLRTLLIPSYIKILAAWTPTGSKVYYVVQTQNTNFIWKIQVEEPEG